MTTRRLLESMFWATFRRVSEVEEDQDPHADDSQTFYDETATNSSVFYEDDGHGYSYAEDDHHDDGGHSEFGVHITYEDLYHSILFLALIYCAGVVSAKVFRMPSLVGEIVAGIILGPPLLEFVPNPEAWVMWGEMG